MTNKSIMQCAYLLFGQNLKGNELENFKSSLNKIHTAHAEVIEKLQNNIIVSGMDEDPLQTLDTDPVLISQSSPSMQERNKSPKASEAEKDSSNGLSDLIKVKPTEKGQEYLKNLLNKDQSPSKDDGPVIEEVIEVTEKQEAKEDQKEDSKEEDQQQVEEKKDHEQENAQGELKKDLKQEETQKKENELNNEQE